MITLPSMQQIQGYNFSKRVPALSTFGTPDITGSVPFASNEPAEAQQRLGVATTNLGTTLGQIGGRINARRQAIEEEETGKQNRLRVENAYNLIKQETMELTVGQKGFQHLKGGDIASNTRPILDGYLKQYDAVVEKSKKGLTSVQVDNLVLKSNDHRTNFSADFFRHALGQEQQYVEDTIAGVVAVEEQAAPINWFNNKAIDGSKNRVSEVLETALKGKPRELIDSKIRDSHERINASVLKQSILNGNIGYAQQYMKNNSSQIGIDDLVRYTIKIAEVVADSKITAVIDNVTSNLEQKMIPGDFSRLVSLVGRQESGNRDFYSDGRAVQSPKGALFEMQVMPETAANPGYGIRPARDGTPEEWNRVGVEKLAAMLRVHNNDLGKALGSQNWGEGHVEEASRKAAIFNSTPSKERLELGRNKTWLDYAPDETKKYVKEISQKFHAGVNTNKIPSLIELKKNVEISLAGVTSEQMEKAKARIESRYNDIKQSVNDTQERVLVEFKQRFDDKEILAWSDIPSDEKAMLGGKREALERYIDAGKKKEQTLLELSPEATMRYSELYHNSKLLVGKPLDEIMKMSDILGVKRVNALLGKREAYIANPPTLKKASIDDDLFKATAIRFNWGKSTNDVKDLILLKDRANEILEDYPAADREMKEDLLNKLFTKYPSIKIGERGPGFARRLFGPNETTKKRGFEIEGAERIIIPANIRGEIIASFKANGEDNPDESEVLDIYSSMLLGEQKE